MTLRTTYSTQESVGNPAVTDSITDEKIFEAVDEAFLADSYPLSPSQSLVGCSHRTLLHSQNISNLSCTSDDETAWYDCSELPSRSEEYLSTSDKSIVKDDQTTMIPRNLIRIPQFRRRECLPMCECRCHKVVRLEMPPPLKQLVGTLRIGASGLPYFTNCDMRSCLRRSRISSVRVSYRFPPWLLRRAVSMLIKLRPLSGPEWLLRTQRVVSPQSLIFTMRERGIRME
jgi:hypothetical protein